LLYARSSIGSGGRAALDSADEAAIELGERAELLQRREALRAAEGGEHGGRATASERLTVRLRCARQRPTYAIGVDRTILRPIDVGCDSTR
jgi:hypothetical protein